MLIKYKNMPTGGASDQRLKEEIEPLKDALPTILRLQPVTWRWKEGDAKIHYGFIAQDVEKVLPKLVSDEENENGEVYKHVATGDLLPYLAAAIKELQKQVDNLRLELEQKR